MMSTKVGEYFRKANKDFPFQIDALGGSINNSTGKRQQWVFELKY